MQSARSGNASFMDLDSRIRRVFDFEVRIPSWGRPPYRGAVFLLGMMMGRWGKFLFIAGLATLMVLTGPLRGVVVFCVLNAVAIIAGAAAGLVHGLLQPVQRRGRPGTWLTWTLVFLAYLGTLSLFAPFSIVDPFVLWALGSASALGALGMVYLDDRGEDRPSPRAFDRLRRRALLLAAPERMWARKQTRLVAFEAGREALGARARGRPEPSADAQTLTRDLRAELLVARRGLELAGRERGSGGTELLAVNAWIEHLDRTDGGPLVGPADPAP